PLAQPTPESGVVWGVPRAFALPIDPRRDPRTGPQLAPHLVVHAPGNDSGRRIECGGDSGIRLAAQHGTRLETHGYIGKRDGADRRSPHTARGAGRDRAPTAFGGPCAVARRRAARS